MQLKNANVRNPEFNRFQLVQVTINPLIIGIFSIPSN